VVGDRKEGTVSKKNELKLFDREARKNECEIYSEEEATSIDNIDGRKLTISGICSDDALASVTECSEKQAIVEKQ